MKRLTLDAGRYTRIALLALWLLVPQLIRAQADSTLQSLVRMALERNPEIRAARAAVGAAEQRGARVGALDDPEVMVQWFANPARSGESPASTIRSRPTVIRRGGTSRATSWWAPPN